MNIIIATNNTPIINELAQHLILKYHEFNQMNIQDKAIVL